MIGVATKTARNTFLDRVVSKIFQQETFAQKIVQQKRTIICQSHLRCKFEEQKENVFS